MTGVPGRRISDRSVLMSQRLSDTGSRGLPATYWEIGKLKLLEDTIEETYSEIPWNSRAKAQGLSSNIMAPFPSERYRVAANKGLGFGLGGGHSGCRESRGD